MVSRKSKSTLAFVSRGLASVSIASSANPLASSKAKDAGARIDIKAYIVATTPNGTFRIGQPTSVVG